MLDGAIKVRRDIEYQLVTVMLNSEVKVYFAQHYRDRKPFGEGAKCQAIMKDLITFLNSRSSELMVNNVSILLDCLHENFHIYILNCSCKLRIV